MIRDVFERGEDEEYLSVNWFEYHAGSDAQRLRAVCTDLAARRDVKKKDKLATIEIGKIKKIAAEQKEDVSVTHEPDGRNRSHSGVWGIPREKHTLHEELAAEASKDLRPVVISNSN